MQKLILFAAVTFIFSSSVSAQRLTDLGITLTNLSNKDTMYTGDTLDIRFSIKNHGPDTLLASDSMALEVKINNVISVFPPNLNPYMSITGYTLFPGDSTFIDIKSILDSNMLGNHEVCGRVFELNTALNFVDTLVGNNSSCITVWVAQKSVGVNEMNVSRDRLKVYPNPASGVLYVGANTSNVQCLQIEMYDVAGKLVYSGAADKEHVSIDISSMPVGNYILKLSGTDGYQYIDKVLKQ